MPVPRDTRGRRRDSFRQFLCIYYQRRRNRLTTLIRTLAATFVAVSLQACAAGETRSVASADSTSASPDVETPVASGQSPSTGASTDTALSSGVGSLRGSIDSALAATQRRVRPRARARP